MKLLLFANVSHPKWLAVSSRVVLKTQNNT